MKPSITHTRWMAGLLLAALVMSSLAPAAQADHRRGPRYKWGGPVIRSRVATPYCSNGSVYVVRRSSAGPAIAGFLGGLFLGATLAHAAPAGFEYYDPYCDERFVSLEVYRTHLHRHQHPRVVRVIEMDSGDCVHSYRYVDGGWRDCDDEEWDD
jgi:hypothetical protein